MCMTFRQEATDPLLSAYRMGLSDKRIDRIQHAIERAIRECEWLPTVATLREFAAEHRYYQPPPSDQLPAPTFGAELRARIAEIGKLPNAAGATVKTDK